MRLTQDHMYISATMYLTHQVHPNPLISLMEIHHRIHQQVHHLMHIIIFIPIHLLDFSNKNIHLYQLHYPVMIIIHRHRTIEIHFLSHSLSLSLFFFVFIHLVCVSFFSSSSSSFLSVRFVLSMISKIVCVCFVSGR